MNWTELAVLPFVGGGLGFLGWYLRSSIETIRREKERLQDERRTIYMQVLEPYIRIFAGINNQSETQMAISQITSFDYRQVSLELNLMGSDDVVRALNELMQHIYRMEGSRGSASAKQMMVYWGKVLLAIRRDLGNKKTKLVAADMLKAQIKDIDQIIE